MNLPKKNWYENFVFKPNRPYIQKFTYFEMKEVLVYSHLLMTCGVMIVRRYTTRCLPKLLDKVTIKQVYIYKSSYENKASKSR